jgi:Family of unknown function (DUF5309)
MSGVAGLRGTGDWGTSERPTNFRERILFISPNGNAPIFALTSKAGKYSVNDPQFSWWAESQNLVRLVTSGTMVATDTLVTVVGTDPTAGTMSALYGSATNLKQGDILMVEPAVDAVTYTQEFVLVDSVVSDTQFTIRRGAGGSTPAGIGNAVGLTLIGSAFSEGTSAPRAVSRNPVLFQNYIQIFKDTYELTGTAAETFARTGNAWSNDKKRKMFDHAKAIEMSFLFNPGAVQVTGDNGKPLRYMGGLRTFIPPTNQYVFTTGSDPTTAQKFADKIQPAYLFDLGGGDTRIGFCGNKARVELGKVIQAATGIKIELGNPVKIFGIDFQEYILPMGRLLLKSHPLLSQHPLYQSGLFVLDFSVIKYTTMKGRPDAKIKDDVQLPDEDVRRGYIQTDCSLMVDGGGLSCAYIGGITAT